MFLSDCISDLCLLSTGCSLLSGVKWRASQTQTKTGKHGAFLSASVLVSHFTVSQQYLYILQIQYCMGKGRVSTLRDRSSVTVCENKAQQALQMSPILT